MAAVLRQIDRVRTELDALGLSIVNGVVDESKCDEYRKQYEDWLASLAEWPPTAYSLISTHRIGYMNATWRCRLASKPIFEALWGTEKLLTSIDAVAIGRPPEGGKTDFAETDDHWLHLDQSKEEEGLHAYQGAVYLETCDEDDWVFLAVPGSHKFHGQFYRENPEMYNGPGSIPDAGLDWYRKVMPDFQIRRIAVPKGGMVVWDARLIHANARPLRTRQNPGRWRYAVIVAMAPAVWASDEDIAKKREVYEKFYMTGHIARGGRRLESNLVPIDESEVAVKDHTEIGKTDEVLRLAGVMPYDFKDGKPCGPSKPYCAST